MIFRMCLLFITRIRGGTGAFMLGDEYSYCFLQQGLRLQLNKQLVNYLTVYNKSYPDLNPSCTAVDTISTLGEHQRFLGMVNYYRSFLPQAASTLKLLTDATCGPGSRSTRVQWTQQLDKLFKNAKAAL